MSTNENIEIKTIPFRQFPKRVARIKNPIIEIPEDFIDIDSQYDLFIENEKIILEKVKK